MKISVLSVVLSFLLTKGSAEIGVSPPETELLAEVAKSWRHHLLTARTGKCIYWVWENANPVTKLYTPMAVALLSLSMSVMNALVWASSML